MFVVSRVSKSVCVTPNLLLHGLNYTTVVCQVLFVQAGATALHFACQKGHLKIAETLITAHASVNAQSNKVSVRRNTAMAHYICSFFLHSVHADQHDSSDVCCHDGTQLCS